MKNSRPQRGQQILQIPIKLSIHLWDLLEQVRIMEVSRGSCVVGRGCGFAWRCLVHHHPPAAF